MQMDASTLTRNMQPLVAQGWLKICAGNDARSRRIEVTAAGREKQAQAQRVWQGAQVAIVAQLGAERVAALHQLLEECIDCLDGGGEGVTEPPHQCP
ncbi:MULTISPECIES: MarR family winged helix-turn-helix transcriptional regulator [Symbiopectobacterium]|uniref:MarR family winged helix-turn-helix transcriptional regulator n=1 Tax=Symbiopectobacterium TaxID=801 RepID=UPI002079C6E2|nr:MULTISPECIES: MarR family winged helix-turn-helix transcriptional regulator [Symbiopectobacterium]MBT9429881.1 winged helix-turn-helix transcriptional regulator [Candidatus Symbiopectobacterium endolongispinus]